MRETGRRSLVIRPGLALETWSNPRIGVDRDVRTASKGLFDLRYRFRRRLDLELIERQ
jgi:hypothetical protein